MPALVILIMAVFNSKGSAEGDQTQAATALRGLIAWPSASSTSDDICTGDDICNELNSMFFDKIDFVQKFKLVYIDILWLVTLSTKFAVWTIVLQKKNENFLLNLRRTKLFTRDFPMSTTKHWYYCQMTPVPFRNGHQKGLAASRRISTIRAGWLILAWNFTPQAGPLKLGVLVVLFKDCQHTASSACKPGVEGLVAIATYTIWPVCFVGNT